MNGFITVMGWICAAALCIALAIFALALLVGTYHKAMERYRHFVITEACQKIGFDLQDAAHWFNESKDCHVLLHVLGARLKAGLAVDASRLRDDWQNKKLRTSET
jgi:hypothetical protein